MNKLITSLKNKEKNKRAFILSNGPSILTHDLSFLKDEVVIGMNASTLLEQKFGFLSKYYVVSDLRFLTHPEKSKYATDLVDAKTIRVFRKELFDFDTYKNKKNSFYITALGRNGFSERLDLGFYFGCTTTMLAIQLAYYLGCKDVYLLGCDLKYVDQQPRFYDEKNPQIEDPFTSIQIMNIINSVRFFENRGGGVWNCSQVSNLYPYLNFAEYNNLF